jgi:uncharacterized protein (DUF2267 family)
MIKAILGILASRMEEEPARKLTDKLPEPLTLQKLRSHQSNVTPLSAENYTVEIREQFKITLDQARTLVNTVLHIAKDDVGQDVFDEIEKYLPTDWVTTIEKA